MNNSATLVVLGDDRRATAAQATAILRLLPSLSLEAGSTAGDRRLDHSVWHLAVESLSTGRDGSGFASLYALLQSLEGKGEAIRRLQEEYEVRIDWVGESDSARGGFILDPVLAARIARLGVPLYGTTVWGGASDADAG